MKKWKKAASWILILTITLSAGSVCAMTQPEDTLASASELNEYGIMHGDPDENMRLEDNVTRAEAAALVYRLYQAESGDIAILAHAFSDMEGHWAAKEVACAKAAGLIDGTSEATFEPEKNVTVQEFIKMTVTLLGYDVQAERQMGYPIGYAMIASTLGLLRGVSAQMEANVSRGAVAVILANALDVPMIKTTESDGTTVHTIMNGENGASLETLRLALTAS